VAATFFPLQCPALAEGSVPGGPFSVVGALTWEEQQDLILGGEGLCSSWQHIRALGDSRSHLSVG